MKAWKEVRPDLKGTIHYMETTKQGEPFLVHWFLRDGYTYAEYKVVMERVKEEIDK